MSVLVVLSLDFGTTLRAEVIGRDVFGSTTVAVNQLCGFF